MKSEVSFETRLGEFHSLDNRLPSIFIVLTAIAISVLLGLGSAQNLIDWRYILYIAIAIVVGVVFLFPRDQVLRMGFYVWIASFALGFRTFHVTSELSIYPCEAIIWILFVALLARTMMRHERLRTPPLPFAAWGFLVVALLSLFVALSNGRSWALILDTFKPTLALYPIIIVTYNLIEDKQTWLVTAVVTLFASAYVVGMGIAEYTIPGFQYPLGDFVRDSSYVQTTVEGFARATFMFWGSPIAILFPVFSFPWLLVALTQDRHLIRRILVTGLIGAFLFGLYISGYRSIWFAFAGMLLVFAYFGGRKSMVWIVLLCALVLVMLPSGFYDRASNLLNLNFTATGNDANRVMRMQQAWNLALANPVIGVGWGGSGWVHNDFLQLAADLGFPGLFLFMLWIGNVLWRLVSDVSRFQTAWSQLCRIVLLTSLVGVALVMAVDALLVLPVLIFPVWLNFALAIKLLEQKGARNETIGIVANV
ncbi:hypothetical protein ANRL3_01884 [Anaerolineae bacterium]|nr:hypothetical protein ANRL3_01884 [Anaerolineae bacterium]